ncbi:hypothetical protein FGO68_gene6258 [Halteria grandinella]|uniref:Uncharacterized protein n=1 Tax=Halteria grandinella TaxID=5974 RepID=A0A8J8T8P0_HALGN|nr:hypothetical protein FGO68_gene6258 [Halteria grandinella]
MAQNLLSKYAFAFEESSEEEDNVQIETFKQTLLQSRVPVVQKTVQQEAPKVLSEAVFQKNPVNASAMQWDDDGDNTTFIDTTQIINQVPNSIMAEVPSYQLNNYFEEPSQQLEPEIIAAQAPTEEVELTHVVEPSMFEVDSHVQNERTEFLQKYEEQKEVQQIEQPAINHYREEQEPEPSAQEESKEAEFQLSNSLFENDNFNQIGAFYSAEPIVQVPQNTIVEQVKTQVPKQATTTVPKSSVNMSKYLQDLLGEESSEEDDTFQAFELIKKQVQEQPVKISEAIPSQMVSQEALIHQIEEQKEHVAPPRLQSPPHRIESSPAKVEEEEPFQLKHGEHFYAQQSSHVVEQVLVLKTEENEVSNNEADDDPFEKAQDYQPNLEQEEYDPVPVQNQSQRLSNAYEFLEQVDGNEMPKQQQFQQEEQKQQPANRGQEQLRKSLLKSPSPAKSIARVSTLQELRQLAFYTLNSKLSDSQKQALSRAIDDYLSLDQLSFSQYLVWTVLQMTLISSSVVKVNTISSLLTRDNVFVKGQREVLIELLTSGQQQSQRSSQQINQCVCNVIIEEQRQVEQYRTESLLSSRLLMNGLIYSMLFEKDEEKKGALIWNQLIVKRFSGEDPLYGVLACGLNQVNQAFAERRTVQQLVNFWIQNLKAILCAADQSPQYSNQYRQYLDNLSSAVYDLNQDIFGSIALQLIAGTFQNSDRIVQQCEQNLEVNIITSLINQIQPLTENKKPIDKSLDLIIGGLQRAEMIKREDVFLAKQIIEALYKEQDLDFILGNRQEKLLLDQLCLQLGVSKVQNRGIKEQASKPIEKAQQVVQGFKGLFSKVVGAANTIGQHIVSEASSANSSQIKPEVQRLQDDFPRFFKSESEPPMPSIQPHEIQQMSIQESVREQQQVIKPPPPVRQPTNIAPPRFVPLKFEQIEKQPQEKTQFQIAKEAHEQQKQQKLAQQQTQNEAFNKQFDPFAVNKPAVQNPKRQRPIVQYASLLHHSEDHQKEAHQVSPIYNDMPPIPPINRVYSTQQNYESNFQQAISPDVNREFRNYSDSLLANAASSGETSLNDSSINLSNSNSYGQGQQINQKAPEPRPIAQIRPQGPRPQVPFRPPPPRFVAPQPAPQIQRPPVQQPDSYQPPVTQPSTIQETPPPMAPFGAPPLRQIQSNQPAGVRPQRPRPQMYASLLHIQEDTQRAFYAPNHPPY